MPGYRLTERAILDLDEIFKTSLARWGETVARRYVSDLYEAFARIAEDPRIGRPRRQRCEPYLMIRRNQHFILYETFRGSVIIVTLIHTRRDVEGLVEALGQDLQYHVLDARRGLSDGDSSPNGQ
ncbi:type II toxin-antitoxin system RelE/ParE family toxin [uncultured Rhodospira sp.]|uniref:type II toxin-antitoxin system RelE/ParE family toxin n=1 Tax=uncultured Rhodospira sp. TaxID=1936189 RepID=UPI00345AADFE